MTLREEYLRDLDRGLRFARRREDPVIFHALNKEAIRRSVRHGICPHCSTQTMSLHSTRDGVAFHNCSRCLVVVALEAA